MNDRSQVNGVSAADRAAICSTHDRRTAAFLAHGFDRVAAARFAIEAAGVGPGAVLDVGTGKGVLAVELARRFEEVVTIDLDEAEQRHAAVIAEREAVAGRVRFLRGDARQMPLPSGAFSRVFLMDALHHLDEGAPVFAEMARVAAPGGLVILAEFSPEGFSILDRIYAADGLTHAVGPVTLDAALDWFAAAGFARRGLHEGQVHQVAVLTRG